MDALYFFAIATIIATTGIGVAIRNALQKIAENPSEKPKILTKMFLYVAAIEVIPVICIIFGFTQLEHSTVSYDIPLALTAFFTIVNIGWCILTKRKFVHNVKEKEQKRTLQETLWLSLGLILAIPILSVVAIFIPSGI